MAPLAKSKSIKADTSFVTLHEEGEWLIGYYHVKNVDGHHFLQIYNTRTHKRYHVDQLVPGHIKSKYIFWKNMLHE